MARANFAAALSGVLAHEGGFVNHPKDPGGATNLGVTLGTAKRLGIDVDGDGDTDIIDIKLLKPDDAAKVYRAEYWDKVRGDDLPSGVDYAVFDFAVNSGPSRAAKFLQRVLGVTQDGVIGPVTLSAAQNTDPEAVIRNLCDQRQAWLQTLSTFVTFGKGWTRRVQEVKAKALSMAAEKPTERPSPSPAPQTPDKAKQPVSDAVRLVITLFILAGLALFIGTLAGIFS